MDQTKKHNGGFPSTEDPPPDHVRVFLRQLDEAEIDFLKSFIRTTMAMGKVGKLLAYVCTIPALGLGFWAAIHWMAEQVLKVKGAK